ncbi:MAG: hypothetical protein HY724_05685, partial [Candidatus Rokubacteria bacterium]|nr:hypothetical protein [Candidatus Rokubacteria bacterium]
MRMIDFGGVGSVADLLGGVLDRIWPKRMTEEERAEAGKQFRRLLMEEKAQEIQD